MNPALMIQLCEQGQSLDRIAAAGCVSLDEAMQFLKSHFNSLTEDGKDFYGDIECAYVPERKYTDDWSNCHGHDAKEFRDGR